MVAMAAAGMFQPKQLPWTKTAPVAGAYVSFIVFNNLSIQVNSGEGIWAQAAAAAAPWLGCRSEVVPGAP